MYTIVPLFVVLIAAFSNGCPDVCTAMYEPVCGLLTDGRLIFYRTFSNACQMDVANCQAGPDARHFVRQGSPGHTCKQQGHRSQCDVVCRDPLVAVCGQRFENGTEHELTFQNDCFFNRHNCLHPANPYTVKCHGFCENQCRQENVEG